jgi:hypothetical protein
MPGHTVRLQWRRHPHSAVESLAEENRGFDRRRFVAHLDMDQPVQPVCHERIRLPWIANSTSLPNTLRGRALNQAPP